MADGRVQSGARVGRMFGIDPRAYWRATLVDQLLLAAAWRVGQDDRRREEGG